MNFPRVTFIIPTLNAEAVLSTCLASIRAQDYPVENVEIVISDGGSTDATRTIAGKFSAVIVDNPQRVAEAGKRVALAACTGDYIVFVDADNELVQPDFTRLAVSALQQYPQALGLESYYVSGPEMNSLCVYLTQTLHISDPVSWIMSVPPVPIGIEDQIERWTFPKGSLAYPLGANGFVYRRSDLDSLQARDDFEDTHVALRLALAGKTEWLRLKNRGVRHYVVRGLSDFIRKRRRQTFHFLTLRHKRSLSWTTMKPRTSPLMACIYCATAIGPVYHTIIGLIRTRDWHWLWHPIACLASVFGLAWGVGTYYLSARTADAEAALQPERKL